MTKKVTELPSRTTVEGDDLLVVVDSDQASLDQQTAAVSVTDFMGGQIAIQSPVINFAGTAPSPADTSTMRIERQSDTRIAIYSGGTPVLIVDGSNWMQGPTPADFRCQRHSNSSGTPAFTSAGDTDTGLGFPANDETCLIAGGVEVLRAQSSGIVRVGSRQTATDPAAFSPTHYIEFEDTAGNSYFVPAMTAAW